MSKCINDHCFKKVFNVFDDTSHEQPTKISNLHFLK